MKLIRKCLSLDRAKREKLAKLLQESLVGPEPTANSRFQTIYNIVSAIFGDGILTRCRDYNLVLARCFIAFQMHNEGYSFVTIGKHLARHYSSVIHMCKRMENIFDYPEYYALDVSHWNEFQKKLKEYDTSREV